MPHEMTGRERLMAVFRGETPDRIPWAPLIDGYFVASFQDRVNVVDVLKLIGADILERHVPTYTSASSRTAATRTRLATDAETDSSETEVTIETVGNVEIRTERNAGRIIRKISTPLGELSEEWIFTETSPYIPFPLERRIKTVDDLKILRYFIAENRFEACYDVFAREDSYVGEDGLATTSVPTTPFQILLEGEMGVERFYYFLQDYPSEMEETMELLHEKNKEIYEIAAASPAQVLINHENTSTTLMSPAHYERYCLKQINEYADIVHRAGKIYLTHMCGKLRNLREQLENGRMDGIIDIAPPPTGDVDLVDARNMWGNYKVVMGGIDATAFTSMSTSEMAAYVEGLLSKISPANRVILGSGDAVPKTARLDNLKVVSDVVWRHGLRSGRNQDV